MIAEQRDRASKSPPRLLEGAIAPRATEKRRDRASSIHHEMTAPDMARSRRVTLIQGAIAPCKPENQARSRHKSPGIGAIAPSTSWEVYLHATTDLFLFFIFLRQRSCAKEL